MMAVNSMAMHSLIEARNCEMGANDQVFNWKAERLEKKSGAGNRVVGMMLSWVNVGMWDRCPSVSACRATLPQSMVWRFCQLQREPENKVQNLTSGRIWYKIPGIFRLMESILRFCENLDTRSIKVSNKSRCYVLKTETPREISD